MSTVSEGACHDIREHLERECPYCVEHLREAAHSIYLLTMTARAARPDPKQKAQLLKRLRKK